MGGYRNKASINVLKLRVVLSADTSFAEQRVLGSCVPHVEAIHTALLSSSSPVFRVVFPQQKRNMKANEVIFKKYIVSLERFYFGPLLCGKPRDK